jgi:hypothetical protein
MVGKWFGAPFPLAAGKNGVAARAEVVCGKRFVDFAPCLGRFWIALPTDGTFLPEQGVEGPLSTSTSSTRRGTVFVGLAVYNVNWVLDPIFPRPDHDTPFSTSKASPIACCQCQTES